MAHPYTAIDSLRRQIRLVTLLPNPDPDDIIECVLSTVVLGEKPYEALSYVWGDESRKTRIQLDDERFMVTLNLEAALHYLRYPHNPRVLWIDALCINQKDPVEKSAQVAFMTDIYDQAQNVLSWLGVGSHSRATHPSTIFDFIKDTHRFDELRQGQPYWAQRRLGNMEQGIKLIFSENAVWRRIWIVQELAMAKNVIFCAGEQTVTMDDMEEFSKSLDLFKYYIKTNPEEAWVGKRIIKGHTPFQRMLLDWCDEVGWAIGGLSRFNRRGTTLKNIYDGVLEYYTSLASDPHDMIYAVRGVCKDPSDTHVDYTQSVRDLYCRFTKRCLEQRHRGLDVLLMDSLFPSRGHGLTPLADRTAAQPHAAAAPVPDLPSWACDFAATLPDGSKVHIKTQFVFYKSGVNLGTDEAHDTAELLELTDSLYELTLSGLMIDKVAVIHEGDPFAKKWSAGGMFSSKSKEEYFDGEPLDDARMRTYLQDFDWAARKGGCLEYDSKKLVEFRSAWKAMRSGPRGMLTAFTGSEHHGDVKRAIRTALEEDQRFAETENDYYACLPSNARVGDVLFVPFRCRMPLLLREVEEGKYRLIGKAYLHGFMDNELCDSSAMTQFEKCVVVLV